MPYLAGDALLSTLRSSKKDKVKGNLAVSPEGTGDEPADATPAQSQSQKEAAA